MAPLLPIRHKKNQFSRFVFEKWGVVRDLAAVGQECIRTLKSERIFESDIWRTTQRRAELENDPKSQETANTSDSLSKNGHFGARVIAPSAALDPIPLKGIWVIALGRESYRHPA